MIGCEPTGAYYAATSTAEKCRPGLAAPPPREIGGGHIFTQQKMRPIRVQAGPETMDCLKKKIPTVVGGSPGLGQQYKKGQEAISRVGVEELL